MKTKKSIDIFQFYINLTWDATHQFFERGKQAHLFFLSYRTFIYKSIVVKANVPTAFFKVSKG